MIFRQIVCTFAAMNNYGTILIVDDNTSILTAMQYLLEGTFERILTLTQPDDILLSLIHI